MYRENKNMNQDAHQTILRGDLYYADLSPVVGSEQGGVRPVLVIQNDVGNKYSPTVIVAAITSRSTKAAIPTHVCIRRMGGGLKPVSYTHLDVYKRQVHGCGDHIYRFHAGL